MNKTREEVLLVDGRIFCLDEPGGMVRVVDPLKNPLGPDLGDDDAVMYDELWDALVAENKSRLEAVERWRFRLTDEWNVDDAGPFATRND